MIRMGRSSRPDENTPSSSPAAPAADPQYRYQTDPQPVGSRAVSESDSMARDIKEGRLSGFVGHGTTLTGETEFQAMLRVDGHLIGTVASETGTLIVGTNGKIEANVSVAAALINGSVQGDIVASEKLQLGRTAHVIGNIQSPRLIVEEGAILEGSCSMLRAREKEEKQSAAEMAQIATDANIASEVSDSDENDDESADAAVA